MTLEKDLNRFVQDPKNRELLQVLKSVRNGVVYGSKLRFAHTLVMQFIFKRHVPLPKKLQVVFRMAKAHGTILGAYALVYRVLLLLIDTFVKDPPLDPEFISGVIGGGLVYGNLGNWFNHGIAHQITLFCGARVTLALGKILAFKVARKLKRSHLHEVHIEKTTIRRLIQRYSWATFASVTWGSVMYLHRYYPQFLQHGLESSMVYIYDDEDWSDLWSLVGL